MDYTPTTKTRFLSLSLSLSTLPNSPLLLLGIFKFSQQEIENCFVINAEPRLIVLDVFDTYARSSVISVVTIKVAEFWHVTLSSLIQTRCLNLLPWIGKQQYFRNLYKFLPEYTMSHPRTQYLHVITYSKVMVLMTSQPLPFVVYT